MLMLGTRIVFKARSIFSGWELTNRCNLQCTHCYAESGPDADVSNQLSVGEYEHLLREAFELGCRKVQFIGASLR